MLILDVSGILVVILAPVVWLAVDYRKWLKVDYVRHAIRENLVLPIVHSKKKQYKIIGVENDGTFILESIDTLALVKLHYRKVKLIWK